MLRRMDFLFKHIKDNHFVLNEEVDRSISKMEEQQAVQYLKRVILPLAVRSWNKAVEKSKKLKDKQTYILTTEDISKTLRKTEHGYHSPEDKTTTDIIRYEAPIVKFEVKGPFKFEIYKRYNSTSLMISMELPGSNNPVFYDVGQSIDESIENQKENTISRFEEQQALDFIKREIIPLAIRSYNEYVDNHFYKPVTEQEIRRNLKKVDVDFPPIKINRPEITHSAYDPRIIFYEAEINEGKWKFNISKSIMDGKLYVTWQHPFNFGGRHYRVGSKLTE